MKSMTRPIARLVILLIYCGTVLLFPAWHLSVRTSLAAAKHADGETCSCCMRMSGGGQRCECDNCTCKMSPKIKDDPAPGAAKPGVLLAQAELLAILESAPMALTVPDSPPTPYLPILTPPPRQLHG